MWIKAEFLFIYFFFQSLLSLLIWLTGNSNHWPFSLVNKHATVTQAGSPGIHWVVLDGLLSSGNAATLQGKNSGQDKKHKQSGRHTDCEQKPQGQPNVSRWENKRFNVKSFLKLSSANIHPSLQAVFPPQLWSATLAVVALYLQINCFSENRSKLLACSQPDLSSDRTDFFQTLLWGYRHVPRARRLLEREQCNQIGTMGETMKNKGQLVTNRNYPSSKRSVEGGLVQVDAAEETSPRQRALLV